MGRNLNSNVKKLHWEIGDVLLHGGSYGVHHGYVHECSWNEIDRNRENQKIHDYRFEEGF